ncbi:hypothetical protein F5141DRAFT_1133436 [Pisolithus sp. B1]|nr:hypothetical protein F5141DRAFT_1133436 [Pisolithus sp. B1]
MPRLVLLSHLLAQLASREPADSSEHFLAARNSADHAPCAALYLTGALVRLATSNSLPFSFHPSLPYERMLRRPGYLEHMCDKLLSDVEAALYRESSIQQTDPKRETMKKLDGKTMV